MKRMRKSMLVVVCLLSVVMTLGAAWTTKQLTNTETSSLCPEIAVDGSSVYAVWEDTSSGNCDIFFRKSTDGGATWQTRKRLTNNTSGNSIDPKIAASGSNVYVVWDGPTSYMYISEICFRRSTDGGATWQPTKKLSSELRDSHYSKIAASGSNVYIVWWDEESNQVYFRKSTNAGATWQTVKKITKIQPTSMAPDIAVNGSNVFVVWQGGTMGYCEIYFEKSTNGGTTWQTAKKITHNTGNSTNPQIAVNGSNIYLVWHDRTPGNYEVYFKRSTDSGTTWKNEKRLTYTTSGYDSSEQDVAVSGSKVYVVYENTASGNFEVYFKKSADGGVTWQTAMNLSNNVGVSYEPKVAASTSKVYVIWYNMTSLNLEIFLKYSPL